MNRKHHYDWSLIMIPVFIILVLSNVFTFFPSASRGMLERVRDFLGNQMGVYYLLMGIGMFAFSLVLAFSKVGTILLGKTNERRFSNFTWGAMIFTGTMAADILFFSLVEWAYYLNEPRVLAQGFQEWSLTYSLFHWGPIPWVVLYRSCCCI